MLPKDWYELSFAAATLVVCLIAWVVWWWAGSWPYMLIPLIVGTLIAIGLAISQVWDWLRALLRVRNLHEEAMLRTKFDREQGRFDQLMRDYESEIEAEEQARGPLPPRS